jgi:hypothetical protein
MKLQFLTLLEHTSSPHSQSLADVIEAGFDKIIPVHTPAHQPGNFEEIPVALKQFFFRY